MTTALQQAEQELEARIKQQGFRAALASFLRVCFKLDCDRFDMHHALREWADTIEHGDVIEEDDN